MELKKIFFDHPRGKWIILIFSLASSVLGLTSPYFQKHFVDGLTGGIPADSSDLISWIALAFVCTITGHGFGILASFFGVKEGVRVQKNISEFLYEKMLNLRADRLGKRTTGEIVSIYATDVPGATTFIEMTIPMGMSVLFPLMLAPIAIHLLFDIPLTSTLLLILFLVGINIVLSLRQSKFFFKFKSLAAERTSLVSEWVQNIRTLRILGWTEAFERKIINKRKEETANRIAMVTNGQTMGAISTTVPFLVNAVGILSLIQLKGTAVTPGELLAILWILGVFLSRPLRMIPWLFTFAWDSISSYRRLGEFLSIQNNDSLATQTVGPTSEKPRSADSKSVLRVQNLNLTIQDQPILKNIDLDVEEGEFLAIVGEVGSGKSILILSLLGETGATCERYDLFENDAKRMSANRLKQHFGYVPQEGFVMSSSLRDNIAFEYLTPETFDLKIEEALKDAQVYLNTENFQDGLSTEIGERGVNLSGGQKQRVALARARFFDRPILLLDDCLSAVDVDTEKKIIDSLLTGAWNGKTRILATHRLTLLPWADRVIFLEDGKIIEQGSFTELLHRSEKFRHYTVSLTPTAEKVT